MATTMLQQAMGEAHQGGNFSSPSGQSTPLLSSRLGLVSPLHSIQAAPSSSVAPVQPRPVLQALPPHRRAEVLLQEMAGLTAHLLELAGATKSWQGGHPRARLPSSLSSAPVPPEGAAATTPKDVLALLQSHQLLLSEAVSEINDLQILEQEKQRVAEAIQAKDAAMRDFAKRVRDAEQVLESTLEEYDEYRSSKKRNSMIQSDDEDHQLGVAIDVQELVSYAHRISYTTFAPPDYAVGQPGTLAPAPQEQQMRASQLYHFTDLDVGLPSQVAAAASPEGPAKAAAAAVKPETPRLAPAQAAPAVPMPPGLPEGIPPMPAGWKPGDPVPPRQPARPPPAPGAVHQVPFVNLDLNPELEEEVSDYSDDEPDSSDDNED